MYEHANNILYGFLRDMDGPKIEELYQSYKSREKNPKVWDNQIKFWSRVVKNWGSSIKVIEFSSDELTKSFVYNGFLPNIQPTMDYLVSIKLIKPKSQAIKNQSLINKITTKVFQYIWPTQTNEHVYVFTERLKTKAKDIMREVEKNAVFLTHTVYSNEELKNLVQNMQENNNEFADCSFELLQAELERTENVLKLNGGFYFNVGNFIKLKPEGAEQILSTKYVLGNVEKRIEELEQSAENYKNRAKVFLSKKRRNDAILMLKQKKSIENMLEKNYKMKENLEYMLQQIDTNDTLSNYVNELQKINAAHKELDCPTADQVDALMDELSDAFAITDEISDSINIQNDEELNAEVAAELNQLIQENQNPRANPQYSHTRPQSTQRYNNPYQTPQNQQGIDFHRGSSNFSSDRFLT